MLRLDALLTLHPNFRLEKWEEMAKMMAGKDMLLSEKYARSARRIVSIWEPKDAVSVRDYAAKVWSGLIRDYYLPRWDIYFKNRLQGLNHSIAEFENQWVAQMPALTQPLSVKNRVEESVALYNFAKQAVPEENNQKI